MRKQTPLDGMLRHLASSATPKALSGALGHFEDRRGSRMQSLINCDNLSVLEDGDMGDVIRVDFRQRWHNAVFVMSESGKIIEITGPGQACGYLMRSFRTRSGPVYWQALIACALCMRHRADPALARAYFVQAYVADRGKPTLR